MRVTQSMLSNNMLRNLSNSYNKMSELQNQINSGKKITRPSQDPVVAIKGMSYRTDLNKVEQFERNVTQVNSWLDSSDDALGQVGDALNRVKELVVQAANDTNTADDRQKIKLEIDQIREQLQDIGNTKVADKFIFTGTKTQAPLFIDGEINPDLLELDDTTTPPTLTDNLIPATSSEVRMEVFDGIQLDVNSSDAAGLFQQVDQLMGKISEAMENSDSDEIGNLLGGIADGTNDTLSELQNKVLEARADVGARQNRVEMMTNRLETHEINVTKQMSDNEDVDYAETITEMVNYESIHQASLSVGANIIQQTLVDFIR
ncbi:flagellar hook protein FlgL [Ureibacillus massiliensis 4400831 = CIP 108448 = CCUG 49529]|uniref:Flagellar hook protein FlgL n=1 Tax=Ureibacillus massiliensis 4400831 = CIP 108448 = CCUG 49529 TaxID=1211035 RepID=A0A0A3J4I0_9BACL|nr:flagellar hook-associated protein FlgL [Ureibacillus massiliensis]KGR90083.1 flagellar hook protein FlgL [Ureibacillus massiliensis 4400831 = CIP 108448 = CCUG 49529]